MKSDSYYFLTSDRPQKSSGGIGIGVGPIILAEYLNRTNLITATSSNELTIIAKHRWAGDLERSISRVMSTNLGRALHSSNVYIYPWQKDHGILYQVTLDIKHLYGTADGYAFLEADWKIYSLLESKVIATNTFVAREALSSDGYPGLVAAESKLFIKLAREIATKIRK